MIAIDITEAPVRTSSLRLAAGTGNRLDTRALHLRRWSRDAGRGRDRGGV